MKNFRNQRGFTLMELVVVIAILGVLAAITVPLLVNYLGGAKERAYNADRARVQAAVDAYYSDPQNPRNLGQRQYPVAGMDATATLNTWVDADTGTALTSPGNPFRGAYGGEPKWRDGGDGIRTETNLNAEAESLAGSGSGWYVVKVTRQGTDYVVDTRNYIIDFNKLTTDDIANNKMALLDGVPDSASADNGGGSSSGSYTWYVDANGRVNSLYYHFPTNGVAPSGGTDNRGLVSGVFP